MTIKIGLVQMFCEKAAIEQNLNATQDYVNQANAQKLDFLCFPEMSITGYINPQRDLDAILSLESPPVARFVKMSQDNDLTLIAGIVEDNPTGTPFITQLVARHGQLTGYYRKINVADNEMELFDAGSEVKTFPNTEMPFGLSICADIDNPVIFRDNARAGAKLIFEAAAPGLYGSQANRNWESGYRWWEEECKTKLGRYSRENNVYIAVATQAGRTRDEDFPGGGYLFGPDGSRMAATGNYSPGLLVVTLPGSITG